MSPHDQSPAIFDSALSSGSDALNAIRVGYNPPVLVLPGTEITTSDVTNLIVGENGEVSGTRVIDGGRRFGKTKSSRMRSRRQSKHPISRHSRRPPSLTEGRVSALSSSQLSSNSSSSILSSPASRQT